MTKELGRIDRIVRYPVKGLVGVPTSEAAVEPGRGLRWDRSHAIENGTVPARSPTGWNPRETYFHVARHEDIVRLGTELEHPEREDAILTITAPGGRSAEVRLDDNFPEDSIAADALLGTVLPAGPLGPPTLSRTGTALWDWPAAQLSLINLATLDALAATAGTTVDGRRFRSNLYLGEMAAWDEFSLIGRRIRVGDATLEVFQPTDRCRATTINPDAAVSDLNVPALLASRFGHLFCGVYARVVSGGTIRVGEPIELLDERAPREAVHASPNWPRSADVVATSRESSTMTSLWLHDPLGVAAGTLPGQHIRVHLAQAEAPGWRCYTVSGRDSDRIRISVKRDGRVSGLLHDGIGPGERIVISGPFGDVTLDESSDGDVLLCSAGAGITPTVAILRGLAGSKRRIRVVHTDRTADDVPLWNEVVEACAELSDARAALFLTRESDHGRARLGALAGRPGAEAHTAIVAGMDRSRLVAYACGPGAFAADLRATLLSIGVPGDAIRSEVFFSPSSAALAPPREPSSSGPHVIRIGDDEFTWSAGAGSVLDVVEGGGIDWQSGCRVGACGTCVQRLHSGTVEYLSDPLAPPPTGAILPCCSAPTSDLVFTSTG